MAESSLTLGWTDFQQEVGFFLGYGRTLGSMSAAQLAEIAVCVQAGIRRAYYPPAAEGQAGHEWSFLRPVKTLYIGASGTDGTTSSGVFDSATFTDWVAQGITTADEVTISDSTSDAATTGDYAITSVATGNITLTTDPGDATGITFVIKRDPADYALPDDFGRLIGGLHFAADSGYSDIVQVPENQIYALRARRDIESTPQYCAVRAKTSTGSGGQRFEILLWPKPDDYYVLTYNYEAYFQALSDSYPYPLGGSRMSELYMASCLAMAEQRVNGMAGMHSATFHALLNDMVMRDRKSIGPHLGHMGHRERNMGQWGDGGVGYRWPHGMVGGTYEITYDGQVY